MAKNDIQGIILAAGFSSRVGEFKPGLDIFGKPAVLRTAETMLEFASKVLVVGGYQFDELKEIVGDASGKIELVYSRNFEKGMFASVLAGARKIDAERFFVIPGDMPFVSGAVYEKLLSADGEIVIPVYEDKKGHPVLIHSRLIPDLLSLGEDSNLRDFIRHTGYQTVEVTEESILEDIDTMGDYYTLLEKYGNNQNASND